MLPIGEALRQPIYAATDHISHVREEITDAVDRGIKHHPFAVALLGIAIAVAATLSCGGEPVSSGPQPGQSCSVPGPANGTWYGHYDQNLKCR